MLEGIREMALICFKFIVYADGLTYIITILQMKGCAIGQVINCTINHIMVSVTSNKVIINFIFMKFQVVLRTVCIIKGFSYF